MKRLTVVILTCILLASCTKVPPVENIPPESDVTEVTPPKADTTEPSDEVIPPETDTTEVVDISGQYDEVTFGKSGSDLLYTASRENCVLPLTFKYSGKTVTVNAPIYTGLPAEAVTSYKRNFIFRDGKLSLDVVTDKGTKRFLIDKNGVCLDMEYSGTVDDSDISSMAMLPSDDFSFTGYVYNGICPVVNDRRLGFADSQGNVLLEPCIEMDYLTTFPKNRDYVPYFMHEDTILLPIGGEFAIITLTRGESNITPKPKAEPLSEVQIPEIKETRVPDEITAALNNELEVCREGEMKLLKDTHFPWSGKLPEECTDLRYALADLDGDGLSEAILTHDMEEVAVLHYDGARVWFVEYLYDSAHDINSDGTYTPYSPFFHECWRTIFNENGKFTLKLLYSTDYNEFFVEGKQVTNDAFTIYMRAVSAMTQNLDLIPYYLVSGIDKSKLSIEGVPEEYASVILGDEPFYMDGIEQMLPEYRFGYMYDRFSYYDSVYCPIDVDSDGVKEILICNAAQGDTLLLSISDGRVNGKDFIFKNMLTKFNDGSFTFTYNAALYGRARLERNGTDWKTVELTREETSNTGESSYFVNNKETTKEEYDKAESSYSNTPVEFKSFIK